MKFSPHKYQQKAIKFMIERACAGLFLDPGMGKTSSTLAAIKILRSMRLVDKVLIVAPLRVAYSTWPAEIEKWDDFNHFKHVVLHGPKKKELLNSDAHIYITNYESLPWILKETTGKPFPFDVLVLDESSKIKHVNTQRFKTLKKMLDKFKRRYILTGSPVPNGLLDLFGQIYCLDMGASLGPYVTHYRETYFYPTGFGGFEWKIKEGAETKIHKILQPRVMRLAAADYLDLPPLIKTNIFVKLPPEAMLKYMTMENSLKAEFESGKITATNSGVATMKCRQIASGSVYDEHGTAHHVHSAKIEALQDLVEELEGQPLLVGYEFKHEAEAILKALGPNTPIIGGGTSVTKGAEIIDAFNMGDIPVLLAQSSALAHGVNLQKGGRAVVWFSLTYNLETYEQFIARVYRQGQEQRVFLYHIIAENTIDHAVLQIVNRKDKIQKNLLQALADYWDEKNNVLN
jgi:SNF2 family DNA or RNA helicase